MDVLDAVATIPGAGTIASVVKVASEIPVIGGIFQSSDPERDKRRDASSETAFKLAWEKGDAWAGLYLRQRAGKRDSGEGDALRIPVDPTYAKDDDDGVQDGISAIGRWGSDHGIAYAATRYDQFKSAKQDDWKRVQALKDAIRAGKPASEWPSRYPSPAVLEVAKAGLPWFLMIGILIGILFFKQTDS